MFTFRRIRLEGIFHIFPFQDGTNANACRRYLAHDKAGFVNAQRTVERLSAVTDGSHH